VSETSGRGMTCYDPRTVELHSCPGRCACYVNHLCEKDCTCNGCIHNREAHLSQIINYMKQHSPLVDDKPLLDKADHI
jgi:hypothetical protein